MCFMPQNVATMRRALIEIVKRGPSSRGEERERERGGEEREIHLVKETASSIRRMAQPFHVKIEW